MRIEHFALNVAEPDKMVKWYCEHLHMKINRKSTKAFYLADKSGNVIIEVYNNPTVPVPSYKTQDMFIFHLAFCSANLDADRKRLIKAGAVGNGGISTTLCGDKIANLRDPWGLAIQLVKRAESML